MGASLVLISSSCKKKKRLFVCPLSKMRIKSDGAKKRRRKKHSWHCFFLRATVVFAG